MNDATKELAMKKFLVCVSFVIALAGCSEKQLLLDGSARVPKGSVLIRQIDDSYYEIEWEGQRFLYGRPQVYAIIVQIEKVEH